ncbi:MAG TPA: glycosyltransferase family 2 protein [Chthoniobacterales bacterium]|jgi:glycosyltransferase involved in cell wall biosynthesis
MNVRFSVLMPVYNREKYVRQAIDSVLAQSFSDYELIAIDDGSRDGSLEVLKSYGNRIRVIQQCNQGPEVARNKAAASALGEYLVFLDSDDYFFPFALSIFDRVIRSFDSPPLVLGSLLLFQNEETPETPMARSVEVFKFKDYLSKTKPIGHSHKTANVMGSIVVRKAVFEEVGGMRNSTSQTFHAEDLHLLLKLGNYSPCIVINEPCTTAYRQHEENSTKDVTLIADGTLRLARSERYGEYRGNALGRYAIIGGRAANWAWRHCWRAGKRKLALRLLLGTAPMVLVALWVKLSRRVRKSTEAVIFLEE